MNMPASAWRRARRNRAANTSCLIRPPIRSSPEPIQENGSPRRPRGNLRARDTCQWFSPAYARRARIASKLLAPGTLCTGTKVGRCSWGLDLAVCLCSRRFCEAKAGAPKRITHRVALQSCALRLHSTGFGSRANFKALEDAQQLRRVAFIYERFNSFGASQFLHDSCQVRGKHHQVRFGEQLV